MHDNLKKYTVDIAFSILSIGISAGAHFILRIFIARIYSVEDLGLYTMAFTVYSFGLVFSGFGIGAGLTKYVSEYKENHQYIKSLNTSGILISWITGLLTGFFLFVFASLISNVIFHMPRLTSLLCIVAFSFPFIAIEKSILGYLNGLRKMKSYAAINIVQNVLTLILTLIFALIGFDITWAVIGFVLPIIIVSIGALLLTKKHYILLNYRQIQKEMKLLFIFGLFVVLANGIGILQNQANNLIIGYYMKESDVGLFAIAATIIQALTLPASAVQLISGPIIAGYWGKKEISNIEYVIYNCMKYSAIYAIIISFIFVFFSHQILGLFFGTEFEIVSLPLKIMLLGVIFSVPQISVGSALSSTNFVNKIFYISGLITIFSLAINIILIPRIGLTGAALGTAITMIVSSILQNYFIHLFIKIKIYWAWFLKLFGITIIMATANYFVSSYINIYITTTLFLIILIILIVMFLLESKERKLILNFLKRNK